MKSKLFIPGSRPELFPKALASQADGLSFDLEDAVAPAAKPQARLNLQAFLESGTAQSSGKTIIVRVNAFDTPYFLDDVDAVVRQGVHTINLPKPDSIEQIREVVRVIQTAEIKHRVTQPITLLLNIETPKSLRLAHALACADSRVTGLQLGMVDLFEPHDIERTAVITQQVMFLVKMAAAEAGIAAYDSSFTDIQDVEGFRREAALSHGMGYSGKTCIHPSQVAHANAIYRPSDAQIAHAQRVLDASVIAEQNGTGAYTVDGKMIDVPILLRAKSILASARASGLIDMENKKTPARNDQP